MRYLIFIFLLFSLSAFSQVPDPTAYYKFDEVSGTTINDAAGTNNGTANGTPAVNQAGKLGRCILMSGDDYVTLPDNADFQFGTGNFSVQIWVNPAGFSPSWKGMLGGETECFVLGTYGETGAMSVAKNDIDGYNSSVLLSAGNWYHIVLTFNSSLTTNNAVLYVNGSATTFTFNYDYTAGAASNVIGAVKTGSNMWNGYIDEVAIWKGTILTSGNVSALYNSGAGLTYPFSGSGTTSAGAPLFKLLFDGNGNDASGNNFSGGMAGTVSATYSNDKIQGTKSYEPVEYSYWKSTNALNISDRTFTISANIKRVHAFGGAQMLFTNKANGGSAGFDIRYDETNGRIYGRFSDGANTQDFYSANSILSSNTWYHVVVIVRSGSVTVFLNNSKLTLADSVITGVTWTNNAIVSIASGTDGHSLFWDSGFIDNFQYYDQEVTTAQADSLYDYRDTPFQLSGGGGGTGGTVTGYKVYYNNTQKRIFYNKLQKYAYRGTYVAPPPASGDTIQYFLADNFNSWTTADFASYDAFTQKLPVNGFLMLTQQSIIDMGDHGNVWRTYIPANGETSMQLQINLGDTARDIMFQYDLYYASNFIPTGIGGVASNKHPGGFYGGNSIDDQNRDTTTALGRAWWAGIVKGSSAMMNYTFYQPKNVGDLWDGNARGDSGFMYINKGYWSTYKYVVHVSTPGVADGWVEIYRNDTLKIRYSHIKMRSIAQGKNWGLVEMIRLMFFFGSGDRLSPIDNYLYMDNFICAKFLPGAVNYHRPLNTRTGGFKYPTLTPPSDRIVPPDILQNETYTANSGVIYEQGANKGYLTWYPYKNSEITKTVNVSGTVNFSFETAEFGLEWPDKCPYVKVYDAYNVLRYTFGRSSGCGYTEPFGTYSIQGPVKFVIMPGSTFGFTKGIAIRYQKQ